VLVIPLQPYLNTSEKVMKKTINPFSLSAVLLISISMFACGGGGSSSDDGGTDPPPPPQAQIFQTQLMALTFNEGVEVVVDTNDLPLSGPTITFEQ